MVATVAALGLNGSKGRVFSAATRTMSKRKASDPLSTDFLQGVGGLVFGAFVDTNEDNGTVGHGRISS